VQAKKESDTDGIYTDAERGADADRLAAMLADMSAAVDSLNLGLLAVAAEVRLTKKARRCAAFQRIARAPQTTCGVTT
jgi:hypothetical protein